MPILCEVCVTNPDDDFMDTAADVVAAAADAADKDMDGLDRSDTVRVSRILCDEAVSVHQAVPKSERLLKFEYLVDSCWFGSFRSNVLCSVEFQ